MKTIVILMAILCGQSLEGTHILRAQARYTTQGVDIVDQENGESVLLRGFGLGGWLLPEGYMWGIRTLDRPRQFEKAIIDLIGDENAREFWRLYHENFLTASDVEAMKAMGANSIRVPLLASRLQPREDQPTAPPFHYSQEGFRFLDSVMVWANRFDIGVIWDMHGAPGGQNAENISDSDGEARLWTEKDTYWPLLTDLWYRIAARYAGDPHLIGYDLLNEPLLRRYDGVDPSFLRDLYVQLTDTIRAVDPNGLIFVEGDDWAQNFEMLEPIDWDAHLVLAFHTYPPTSDQNGLDRWDNLRKRYHLPLWHGETGEQTSPFALNRKATRFLESANVGWSWWTHKKLGRQTQPWVCPKTKGFQKILDYWMGRADRPSAIEAKHWLFEQARRTRSDYCTFLPDMVASLEPFDPTAYERIREPTPPSIYEQPEDMEVEVGEAAVLSVKALGFPLEYSWQEDGKLLDGQGNATITFVPESVEPKEHHFRVSVSNELGAVESREAVVIVRPFIGPEVPRTETRPVIDGEADPVWRTCTAWPIDHLILQSDAMPEPNDISGSIQMLWDDHGLYLLIRVTDDTLVNTDPRLYENDGVEVYVDLQGDKTPEYGSDDFHFVYVQGHEPMVVVQGTEVPEIAAAQTESEAGYQMEIALPFSALSADSIIQSFVGIEVQINDNDKDRLEDKLAWLEKEDNAYVSPAHLGTIRLADR